jgi:glycosyltransferase involved in cell wall biosynthesis
MRIAIIHYSSWPVIGGVETVIRQHAQLMTRHRHSVTILCGMGSTFSPDVPIRVIPELDWRNPIVTASQEEAYNGNPGEAYSKLLNALDNSLGKIVQSFDRIIAHNMFTMPFNLAATQALGALADRGMKVIAWTHDLAAINPDYHIPQRRVFSSIRERHQTVKYVTVSDNRALEFKSMTGFEVDAVVPNALDFAGIWGISSEVANLVDKDLPNSMILFFPTRILERKNIGFALQIAAALRDLGQSVRLLISGASNLYNRSANEHLAALKQLAADLRITELVTWVNESFAVGEPHLRSLYAVADAVLYPSRQEGFGLPLLEAAAFRLPIFCSNIEPLKSIAHSGTHLFDLRDSPRNIASRIRNALEQDPGFQGRKQLLRKNSAERVYVEKIEPLLQEPSI